MAEEQAQGLGTPSIEMQMPIYGPSYATSTYGAVPLEMPMPTYGNSYATPTYGVASLEMQMSTYGTPFSMPTYDAAYGGCVAIACSPPYGAEGSMLNHQTTSRLNIVAAVNERMVTTAEQYEQFLQQEAQMTTEEKQYLAKAYALECPVFFPENSVPTGASEDVSKGRNVPPAPEKPCAKAAIDFSERFSEFPLRRALRDLKPTPPSTPQPGTEPYPGEALHVAISETVTIESGCDVALEGENPRGLRKARRRGGKNRGEGVGNRNNRRA